MEFAMNPQTWSHQRVCTFQYNNIIIQEVSVVIQLPNGDVIKDLYLYPSWVTRIRGGMDNPNVDDKTSEIPYLKDQRFIGTDFHALTSLRRLSCQLKMALQLLPSKATAY